METKNTNRIQTDRALFRLTVPQILSLIPPEKKTEVFDYLYTQFGDIAVDLGHIRTENMAEDYLAVVTDGEVVQVTGYDVINTMKDRTQVKTTGTRKSSKARQASWKKYTAQVKLPSGLSAEYVHVMMSLNYDDGTSTAVQYLIPRIALLTDAGTIRTQIDFDYGFNSSLDTRCPWHPYLVRSEAELAERYLAMPVMKPVEELFENL
jgi:hypothetical protein